MNKNVTYSIRAALACLLALAMVDVASAHSSYGGGCAGCHNRATSPALTVAPNPLDIKLNQRGLLSIQVTSMGSSSTAALSVQKLGPPNSLPINANVVNTANGIWHYQVDSRDPTSTDPNKASYIMDSVDQTGLYTMDLGIGSLATPGTYPITVFLAGDGRTGVGQNFSLIVSQAALAGDFNHDNKVDAADYTVWRDGLGSTYTLADYDTWKSHFGQSAGAAAVLVSSSAVPEPVTAVILLTCVGAMLIRPARRRM